MRNLLLCLLASLWLAPVLAASNTTVVGESASPELVLPLGSLPERVCWFADQKYSEGARILQGDIWLECGPLNASIHKVNEQVPVADLERLSGIYRRTLENLLG